MMGTKPVVYLDNFSYTYAGEKKIILRDINMRIMSGECHCITGPTGSGKTTLLLALKHLLPAGSRQGDIWFASSVIGSLSIGLVLQNPETQLLCTNVGAEVAFGLENLCIEPGKMSEMVQAALLSVDLDIPLSFDSRKLSMGQKYRLILASFLTMNLKLFLLDEPCAQLDNEGINNLVKVIEALKSQGVSFLITEHRPQIISNITDCLWGLCDKGTIRVIKTPEPLEYIEMTFPQPVLTKENILTVNRLFAGRNSDQPILSGISFSVKKAQRVVVSGENGSGKTTLLRCLAGFEKIFSGNITFLGKTPDPKYLQKKVGFLFQNPDRQLFENTVIEEVMFPLKRLMGGGVKNMKAAAENALFLCGIADLSNMSPHKLSYGQKHLVTLASTLASSPEVLILDDPFAGLDKDKTEKIMLLLADINNRCKTTIIMTSHNWLMSDKWAHVTLVMKRGNIVQRL